MSLTAQYKSEAIHPLINGTQITKRDWTIDSAYRYCQSLARSHYENFPVGSRLVPKALRKHVYCVYAFARTADDFADEGDKYLDSHQRLDLIDRWREMLRDSFAGRATHPVFIALADTCKKFDLPIVLFEDLLSAFSQDVTVKRYETFDQLMDYCRRSANPVGRLILNLFGHTKEEYFAWSDAICTALQLANHWQDVNVDLDKDRIYIPLEDIERFRLSVEQLKERKVTKEFQQLMEFEIHRARELFIQGRPLCVSVHGRLGLELRAVWAAGWRVLERIAENRYDVFERRPVITFPDKLRILFFAISKEAFLSQ